MVNFVIITYSLTGIKDQISLEIYVPIILFIVILTSILTGKHFKKIQLGTDTNELFKHSPDLVKTLRLILEGNQEEKKHWVKKLRGYETE